MQKLSLYLKLMRFDRPIGTFLLLWPTLWAVWLGSDGHPSVSIVVIFVLGVTVMRAAGCVINDIADRHFDPHVERTKNRPLASGALTLPAAIGLFIVLMLIALLLVLQLNLYSFLIALIAAALTIVYPFCKRFTHLPQLVLSITFKSSILMAFAAQQNHLPPLAWVLYFSAVAWMIAYDTMYALTDQNDDEKLGLKSTAILFGKWARHIILLLQVIFLLGLILAGIMAQLNIFYWLSLIIALLLCLYQQKLLQQQARQTNFKAFLNNNWLGLSVFIGIVLSYLF